jgi:hypothetical protein
MKTLLSLALFCPLVVGQSSFSSRATYAGAAQYATSACGPANGYACLVQDANLRNFSIPGPNWGPNACDWTSPYPVQN